MKVLIVKVSALGDIVHALPVLDYLHQVSPGIEIDWVVEEGNRELLEGNPLIRRVYTVRTRAWRRRPFSSETRREVMALRNAFLEREYDIVFDLQGNLKSGLITYFSGAERRYGFDREGARESLNLLFTNNQAPLRRQDQHVSARSLRVVSVPFGRDYAGMTLAADIQTSTEDDAVAEALLATLSDGLAFLFHPGTTWQTKMWHEAGWIALGKLLMERFADASILISWGGAKEREAGERIAAAMGGNVRLLPAMTLKGFAALLKKVDMVVGGDTGPVHMAAAVGTPTLSFYRVTDPKRNAPVGERHLHVQTPFHCRCCLRKECDRERECREAIKPEMMLKAVEKLMGLQP